MASLVGLDPVKDIRWVTSASHGPMDLFIEGKIDAFVAHPPILQDVRARNIGHVIASSITIARGLSISAACWRPAQSLRRNIRSRPKRVLRAILKAADLCASQPARWHNYWSMRYTDPLDYALQTLSEIRYDVWRDYDPEDSLRFYALRMHEAGLIKSSPQKLIAEHTDWRFLNELKRELKT